MRILYNFWGHLTDKIDISSADGNFSYSFSIINELTKNNHEVFGPPIDRDAASIIKYGINTCFKSFSTQQRMHAYKSLKFVSMHFLPKIDILLIEWRFPTHYNQQSFENSDFHPDLLIQKQLLNFYANKNISLKILNLDNQLTEKDEDILLSLGYEDITILEQALALKTYKIKKETIFIPFNISYILQHGTKLPSADKHLVYIGNDYGRRNDIETKILPYAKLHEKKIVFVGNWMRDDQRDIRKQWDVINFHPRIGAQDFYYYLSDAVAVPLLAPEEYKESSTMTMRILESLLFGSIPIGFSDFKQIDYWLLDELIINMEDCLYNMKYTIQWLLKMRLKDRLHLREIIVRMLDFHDARYFIQKVLD